MIDFSKTHVLTFIFFLLALAGCNTLVSVPPSEQQIRDAAWAALEPNTASHDRAHWDFVQVKSVTGGEVASQFNGEAAAGCWMGPTPVPNQAISATGQYWYIELQPRPATPIPQKRTVSPTEPSAIPEAFLRRALIVIDASNGRVVARQLSCVIY